MPLLVKKFADCPEVAVPNGATLRSFARDNVDAAFGSDLKRAEAVAQLNFGTKSPREAARGLAELVGVKLADAPDLEAFATFDAVADLPLTPEGQAKLRVPVKWTVDAQPVERDVQIKVKPARPANTVVISQLDKWFVPEAETCGIGWKIGGREATAGTLQMDVYASKYCKFNAWGAAHATYTETADLTKMPVFSDAAVAHRERGDAVFDWTGETTATDGCLIASGDPQAKRYVNVAFSPYTAHMRYFKAQADAEARLELKPFWPAWDKDDNRVAASFKIKWALHDTGGKLKQGLLTIVDGEDRPVFRKRLVEGDLADGDHEFDWGAGDYSDGVSHGGKTAAEFSQMPYRVKIEAHRPAHEDEGLALAAMHSEVRIWVNPATLHKDADDYLAANDVSSLLFSVAELNHTAADWDRAANANLWLREKLAAAGFFPGPVKDSGADAALDRALIDFKRSVPKVRAGGAGDYERIDDHSNAWANIDDVRDALEAIGADTDGFSRYVRKWFGKADATRDDYDDNWGDALRDKLRDPAEELIVWVDDRHFYTSVAWVTEPAGHNPLLFAELAANPANERPDRGGWMVGDPKIDHDARDMPQGSIPLQVQPVLMKKDRTLHDRSDYLAAVRGDAQLLQRMRNAMGPIRIDWSFDEIDGDFDPTARGIQVQGLDATMYSTRSRSKTALEKTLDRVHAIHQRKDVKRQAVYHNARFGEGGIRPRNSAVYYQAAFGRTQDDAHLLPWKTSDDAAIETVATTVHDDLGPGHAPADKFAKRRGLSGINFTPSLAAGDGYRLRAQVRFDDTAGFALPNREALKARYPLMAQAHAAKMRTWRKSSVRAHVQWSPHNHLGASWQTFRKHFAQANVHYVVEGGGAAPQSFRPSALFPQQAADADYREAAQKSFPTTAPQQAPFTPAFHDDYVWPWHTDANLGMRAPVRDSTARGADIRRVFDGFSAADPMTDPTYVDELANAYMVTTINLAQKIVDKVEQQTGLMRGNVIVEMQTSPAYYYMDYECKSCHHTELWLERTAAPSRTGRQCSRCAAPVRPLLNEAYFEGRYTCSNGHAQRRREAGAGQTGWNNALCDQRACGGLLAADTIDHATYTCGDADCGFNEAMPHIGGAHRVGEACPRGCGNTLKPTADVYATQDYECDACGDVSTYANASKKKDEHGDGTFAHNCVIGGQGALRVPGAPNYGYDFTDPGVLTNQHHVDVLGQCVKGGENLPGSSLGLPMGVSVNFNADTWGRYTCAHCGPVHMREPTAAAGHHLNKYHRCTDGTWRRLTALASSLDTNPDLWAHEVGHNHSLSHANNAGGAVGDEHDDVRSTWATAGQANEAGDWDRTCLMAYTDFQSDYDIDLDKQYMCYRCLLRSRGWKVTALPKPAGVVRNP